MRKPGRLSRPLLESIRGWPFSSEERLLFAGARLRVISFAFWVGWVSLIAIFAATAVHTTHLERAHHLNIWLLLGAALAFHAGMYAVPWRRLATSKLSEYLLYAWAGAILAFVTLLLWMSGPFLSDFYLVYLLLILFAAAAFSRRIYVAVVVASIASYLAIASLTTDPRDLLVRFTAIALIAVMAGHLANEQRATARSVALLHEAMVDVARDRDAASLETGLVRWARRLTEAPAAALVHAGGAPVATDPPDASLEFAGLPLEKASESERPMAWTDPAQRTSTLLVPLGDGRILLVSGIDETFRTLRQYLLETLAAQAKVSMETARLQEGLRQKERARAATLGKLIRTQEEERRRIARDLHDGTGQDVAGLVVGLEALERTPGKVEIAELKELARGVADELRRLTLDLRPRVLDDLGLAAALRWLGHERHPDLGVRLDLRLDRSVSPTLETGLFRIVQEALTNAERHAHASEVKVGVEAVDGRIRVVVEDDGRGFDTRAKREGFGLVGMEERAEQLGGELHITSAPGRGTRVEVDLPAEGPDD